MGLGGCCLPVGCMWVFEGCFDTAVGRHKPDVEPSVRRRRRGSR